MDLLQNPFHILSASPLDNRRRLMDLADERSLNHDASKCKEAHSILTNPRKRLSAEVAWFPDLGQRRTGELLLLLESSPIDLPAVDKLSPIHRTNLLAAGLVRLQIHNADYLASWVLAISWSFEDIDAEKLRQDINEERIVSGFPEVLNSLDVESEIKKRGRYYLEVIKSILDSLSSLQLVKAVTIAVETSTKSGKQHGPSLIEDLVGSYEAEALTFLEKEEENIKALVKKIQEVVLAKRHDSTLPSMISQLIQVVKNWDTVAQPIQVSAMSRGLDHGASHRIAWLVRNFAIDMFNKHGDIEIFLQITGMLQEVFAEVGKVAERLADDVDTIGNIVENRASQMGEESMAGAINKDTKGFSGLSGLASEMGYIDEPIDTKPKAKSKPASPQQPSKPKNNSKSSEQKRKATGSGTSIETEDSRSSYGSFIDKWILNLRMNIFLVIRFLKIAINKMKS